MDFLREDFIDSFLSKLRLRTRGKQRLYCMAMLHKSFNTTAELVIHSITVHVFLCIWGTILGDQISSAKKNKYLIHFSSKHILDI
jgi:hypothetical protein